MPGLTPAPSPIISIHALLAESDLTPPAAACGANIFLSTLSLRRATNWPRVMVSPTLYFYPRSPCGERPRYLSIPSWNTSDFYPRSPCGERQDQNWASSSGPLFLSTLSLRRATALEGVVTLQQYDFYPRSPCGERHRKRRAVPADQRISIHALLAESDANTAATNAATTAFLSTLSLRRATRMCLLPATKPAHFYPRSPCGERQPRSKKTGRPLLFLSTLSLRRATEMGVPIPALPHDFYPRSPCGERRVFERVDKIL